MKSVGEVMAMGRTFQESFQKALRGLEVGVDGLDEKSADRDEIVEEIGEAGPDRIWYVGDAFRIGMSLEEVHAETAIDPWFLAQIEDIVKTEGLVKARTLESLSAAELRHLKQKGFSDRRLARLLKTDARAVREARIANKVRPVYKRVDTCAAEFATNTAYMYSTYEAEHGECVQYGGQTPLKLALDLEANGVPIIGTSPESIDVAEDRERFQKLLNKLGLRQPPNRTARTEGEALAHAAEIGYPLVVRPSYVLGGRAMEIVHEQQDLERYMREAVKVSNDSPVLLDRFLNNATEVDVDCLADGETVFIGGVMEHIEQAGVHSGDSACSLPPYSLSADVIAEIKRQTTMMAKALNVSGLMNVQFAIQGGDVYVLEVNPRASRTVPYVSKATGLQLAKIAARAMAGQTLAAQGITKEVVPSYFSVKEAVFPFVKFPGVDTILGPEMKSTGEVMGVGMSFGEAFVKSQLAAGVRLPDSGTVFISVKNQDKPLAVEVARGLHLLGFKLVATRGTAAEIEAAGIPVQLVNKVTEGRPHIVDMVKNGEISLVINTVEERRNAIADSRTIRTQALAARVTFFTTIAGARAAVEGMQYLRQGLGLQVYPLQELHASLRG
ncbi:Phosphoribosylglycinamide formyltransferase 2 [compost metagenome]